MLFAGAEESAAMNETCIDEVKSSVKCVRNQGNKDLEDVFLQKVLSTLLWLEGSVSSCVRHPEG